ncbi:DEKNAAC104037 [Brettanomyces naardenensis]|uniref:DEKNAAC104037 n=1 Tax=Brettanomyces naardenensis TaxID=13370 RepID=A0A448YQD5_BRENA|nr:DEKNAAC104037 [Brettanomyces naardenensis]
MSISSSSGLDRWNFYHKDSKKMRTIFVPYKGRRLEVDIEPINYDRYEHDRLIVKKYMKDYEKPLDSTTGKLPSRSVIESKFFTKIFIIWRMILIPNVFDRNSYLLLTHIGLLIARTWLSLLVTKLDGQIMKDLMGFKIKLFLRDMVYWFLFAVPASYVNSGIKYLTKRLALNFRTNMVRYCHDLYMNSRLVYYKLQFNHNELPDYRLSYKTIDQNLTEDIRKFCDSLTSLFANVGKPAIDLVFFAIYLRDNIGTVGILAILSNYLITGMMLKRQSPNFNRLWKKKTQMEGIYYNYNLNLVNNCEEISFYKGIGFERRKVYRIFKDLADHIVVEIKERFAYQLFEDYILKFTWPAFGYIFAGLPILFEKPKSGYVPDETSNMKSFVVNKRLILSMADAGSRLMYSIKDINRLSGVTDIVFTLLVNLHQVHDSNFQYGLTNSQGNGFSSNFKINSFVSRQQLANGSIGTGTAIYSNGINGTIQNSYPGLRMERIPVIVPSPKGVNGKHLLNNLSFNIAKGQNLMILGKNGVGKTAIVRIISELWPLYSGLLSKPSSNDIYYVSQRQYFITGSLRDQIIYPLNHIQMLQKGFTDETIIGYMNEVGLGYLLERFGSLDYNPSADNSNKEDEAELKNRLIDEVVVNGKSVQVYDSNTGGSVDGKKSWFSLLSGGERQKVVFTRILFHNKPFVVMDEPTSAISYDYEDSLFEFLRKKNITLITITNRDSLMKYHDYLLELVDEDHIRFTKIDEEYLKYFESADSEVKYLEGELRKMRELRRRRDELKEKLEGYEDGRSSLKAIKSK